MKSNFDIKNFLTANREMVIAKYNDAQSNEFFNGMSLRDFMVKVMNSVSANRPASEKTAARFLEMAVSFAVSEATKIGVVNDLDKAMARKYNGTAYMALV